MEEEGRLLKRMKQLFSEEIDKDDIADEIMELMQEGFEQGVFAVDETEMVRNVFLFKHMDAKDVMTHRKHITALDGDDSLEEAIQLILKERYSRFPVFEETIDQIIGSVHIRDVMRCYMDAELRQKPLKDLKQCVKPVSFIPETRKVDRLFKQMQAKKKHMVVILDEYGQTSGIVTLEDIIEEIVGNIQDEYDEDVEEVVCQPDGTYIVQGITDLTDLENILGVPFEKEDYETLNGFLVDQLDRIPSEDEVCSVDYEGYRFLIQKMDDKMIKTVKIVKM